MRRTTFYILVSISLALTVGLSDCKRDDAANTSKKEVKKTEVDRKIGPKANPMLNHLDRLTATMRSIKTKEDLIAKGPDLRKIDKAGSNIYKSLSDEEKDALQQHPQFAQKSNAFKKEYQRIQDKIPMGGPLLIKYGIF